MTLIEAMTRSDNTNQKNNRQIFREMMLLIEVVFTMMMMKIAIAHPRKMGALQYVSLHLINYCCLYSALHCKFGEIVAHNYKNLKI